MVLPRDGHAVGMPYSKRTSGIEVVTSLDPDPVSTAAACFLFDDDARSSSAPQRLRLFLPAYHPFDECNPANQFRP